MKRKKNIALILVFGMLFALLGGCKGINTESIAEQQASTDTSAVTIDAVDYTPVDAAYPVADTSTMTLLADRIWYLGKDSKGVYYICSVKEDGSDTTGKPLAGYDSTAPNQTITCAAFSEDYLLYADIMYAEDGSGIVQSKLTCVTKEQQEEVFRIAIDTDLHTSIGSVAICGDTFLCATDTTLYKVNNTGEIIQTANISAYGYALIGGNEGVYVLDQLGTYELYQLNVDTLSAQPDAIVDGSTYDRFYRDSSEYILYGINGDGLFGLSEDGGATTLTTFGNNGASIRFAFVSKSGIPLIARNNLVKNAITELYLAKQVTGVRQRILHLAVSDAENINAYIALVIEQFNFENVDCQIVPQTYSDKELALALTSGDPPDLILFDNSKNWTTTNYDICKQRGYLQDLFPLMDADKETAREDILPNVLTALESDGKLYGIPHGFQARTIYAPADSGAKENWTMDDMIKIANQLPDDTGISFAGRTEFLTEMIKSSLSEFVDGGNCNFTSETFLNLLELCKDNFADNAEGDSDKYLLNYLFTIGQLDGLCSQIEINVGSNKVVYTGFPGGFGGELSFYYMMAIPANCTQTEDAWSFVKLYYTSTGTNAMMHILNETFAQEVSFAQSIYDEDIVDAAIKIVTEATSVTDQFSPIPEIVAEEAEAYFAGDKSAGEVSKIIQNRVSIYLSEQR